MRLSRCKRGLCLSVHNRCCLSCVQPPSHNLLGPGQRRFCGVGAVISERRPVTLAAGFRLKRPFENSRLQLDRGLTPSTSIDFHFRCRHDVGKLSAAGFEPVTCRSIGRLANHCAIETGERYSATGFVFFIPFCRVNSLLAAVALSFRCTDLNFRFTFSSLLSAGHLHPKVGCVVFRRDAVGDSHLLSAAALRQPHGRRSDPELWSHARRGRRGGVPAVSELPEGNLRPDVRLLEQERCFAARVSRDTPVLAKKQPWL